MSKDRKKITFNALLNHKAHNYKPMQIEVEKIIPLYGKRFEQMKNHPLDMFSVRENTSTQYWCLQRENFMFSVMTTGKIAVSFR